ncbi:MAG: hypothetical protein JWR19_1779 [Pedosphaera sp.]|nr:hypothetical protein [Pedosphaera sp.]
MLPPLNFRTHPTHCPRNRLSYGAAVFLVIALGLGSRRYPIFPLFIGDILWALMVFLGFGFRMPARSTAQIATFAALFSTAIEFSQLYHAPWIDAIRRTRLGGLALGFTFMWGDLLAYAVGIALGIIIEFLLRCYRHKPNR